MVDFIGGTLYSPGSRYDDAGKSWGLQLRLAPGPQETVYLTIGDVEFV